MLTLPHEVLAVIPLCIALVAPVLIGTKYAVQFTKDVLPNKTPNITRVYALLLGGVALPVAALFFGAPVTIRPIGVEAVFGVASGLAAVGDYHLLSLLEGVAGVPPPPPNVTPLPNKVA